ncbi:MAG: DUF111 family protein, partial [Chitinispirillaceae bacterium]|nr:DUF111 family protein [Chitinispirillaceae bacterium]
MRIIYFDLLSGAAGDMLLASLIDLGFPLEILKEAIKKLPLKEKIEIAVEKTKRNGILCTLLTPKIGHSHSYRHKKDILDLIKGNVPEKIYISSEKILNRLAEAEAKVHGIDIEEVHFHEIGAVDTIID